MSFAEIERFAADLQTNEAVRAEAEKAEAGMSPETPLANAIAFAATKGYDFTADDIVKAGARAAGKELTDAELGGIVGGGDPLQKYMDAQAKMQGDVNAAMAAATQGPSIQGTSLESDVRAQTASMLTAVGQFVEKTREAQRQYGA
jgi:hypothetical protein